MSLDPEILELIHADIDGLASERDLARLREAIARDPEVREEYRRLRGLTDVLARVDREEPPARIAPAVMAAVRSRRGVPAGGVWDRLRRSLPTGPVALRYAYAVAAGAVLGILGMQLLTSERLLGAVVPDREASATLAPVGGPGRLDLAPAGLRGFATVRPSPTGTAIGVDLDRSQPAELVLRYDPSRDADRVDVLVVKAGTATPAGSLRLPK